MGRRHHAVVGGNGHQVDGATQGDNPQPRQRAVRQQEAEAECVGGDVRGGGVVALHAEDAGQQRGLDAERGGEEPGGLEAMIGKSADLPSTQGYGCD